MPEITNNGRKISKNNTSGYTGVSFESVAGKYRAYVHYSGEKIALGYFPTAVEAARARAAADSSSSAKAGKASLPAAASLVKFDVA